MNRFIVTYDLKKTFYDDRSDDYKFLYGKLQSYYKYAKVNESSWIIQTWYSCEQLYNDLKKCLNKSDALFVSELKGKSVWINSIDTSEKIKDVLN